MDDLSNQMQFRLEKIKKIGDSFYTEICEREQMSKKLSKYVAAFDYSDKILIVLSAPGGGVSIISFTVGILSASFSLALFLTTEIIDKLFQITINKKKKQN